jgi:hypothetical protein
MNIMTRLFYKLSLLSFGSLILLISCGRGNKSVAKTKSSEILPEDIVELREDQISLAKVELGAVEMKSLGNILKVNGVISVAPQNFATVCMPLGGFIKNTSLIPGNAVNKGQILAVIENQDFVDIQQSYLEAKNKLVFSEADFKRHTDLYKDDVYSAQNVQQVTIEYKNLSSCKIPGTKTDFDWNQSRSTQGG